MIAPGSSLRGVVEVIAIESARRRRLAHQRALGAVTVAAAAEDADEDGRMRSRPGSSLSSAPGVWA